ncbi:ATP-dependent helicase HrpB [Ilumatobacter sp.]|uniref:ATP-dependent helicase HrpB n=1 Tax=Ilumatobacter sp. TaxID=1967498 RepID=UPI003AF4B7E2
MTVPGSPARPLPDLPVVETIAPVAEALADARRAVLVAPPGAGKTTVVPIALLDEPWLADQRIVMLEPRRLATRAAARRMADILGESVGDTVGYQTRDERHIGADTRIEVVTEGILTRRLQNDPELPGVGLVVFDEVHERNLPTDLGLALLTDAAATLRPDLRILAMSATPDTKGLVGVLGTAPVVESDGRMHPVDLHWVPRGKRDRIDEATTNAVLRALNEQSGDVLVFLPGIGEINRTKAALDQAVGPGVDVHRLAGALSLADQDTALAPSPPGRRRVVLSTDIAETSLTVDGVRVVVDSGLARAPRFDTHTGMTRLTTITTSRASAEQRAGRAGRVEPGACYRLWSKIEHGSRAAHRAPEIEEVDLAGLMLELAAWGTPVDELAFITPPPRKAVRAATDLLHDLGAIDADGRVTDVGRRMMGLPVHPRLARMLVAEPSPLGCALAVLIDERDLLRGRPDDLPADLSIRLQVLSGRAGHDLADRGAVRRLRDRAHDLARRLRIRFDTDLIDADRAGGALLHAFPDRLAARRRPGQFQLRTGSGAWLPDTDPLAHESFLVAADLDGRRDRARIRLAAALDADDVVSTFADEIDERVTLEWDDGRDDLVERVERRLGAMRLGSITRRPSPGDETTAALMRRAGDTGLAALGWSKASIDLRRRVDFLHRTVGDPWPDWSIPNLVETLDAWLAPYLPGATGRRDLDRVDLAMVLRSQLPWPEGAELDRLAPGRLDLPTGRSVSIDYSADEPAAHVRVQDLFGTTTHPTAGGRPIVLHLLSPADRPIQITSDLPGFWAGTWNEVRKDLAGRYPKHRWPDDPATAPPKRLKDR